MTNILDDLISEGFKELPHAKGAFVGGTLPGKRSPIEGESTFIRHVAWFNVRRCRSCNTTQEEVDGIYEEREWNNPTQRLNGKHWLRHIGSLFGLTLAGRIDRTSTVEFCPNCLPESLPLLETHSAGDVMVTMLTTHQRS